MGANAEHPDPLVAADVDLRDFSFTPMYRSKLFGSCFHARVSDAGWRAGVTLWLKSWDQVPAGTLPDDDVDLCRLAELGRDLKTWRKLSKEALWGWFKCSDGRYHHSTVASGVTEAWSKKLAQRDRTAKARATSIAKRQSQGLLQTSEPPVTEPATERVTRSKGQGQGQGQGIDPSDEGSSPPPRSVPPDDFDPWLRGLLGQEPVVLVIDTSPIRKLLDEGITRADIDAGIASALAKHDFRPQHWGQLVGWIRRAAKDRLGAEPRVVASKPSEPTYDLGSHFREIPESNLPSIVHNCVERGFWPYPTPKPGQPGCVIPERFWPEHLRTRGAA